MSNGQPAANATPTSWLTAVRSSAGPAALNDGATNGLRWSLIVDRTVANVVSVDRVEIAYSR